MLRVEDLSVSYGKTPVLFGISLSIEEGELVGLIGGNGAGKTTTLRTISGQLNPRSGQVVFLDTDISGFPAHRITALGISHCPEQRELFPVLSVLENLKAGAFLRTDQSEIEEDLSRVFDFFPTLRSRTSQRAGSLSGGEQQMLAIGRSIMTDPKLLLLDEISLGLAPQLVETAYTRIRDLYQETGLTILVVEQNAEIALEQSNRAYVLETGRIVLEGSCSQLRENEKVKEAYLGKV